MSCISWRCIYVDSTLFKPHVSAWRCIDVDSTSYKRHVPVRMKKHLRCPDNLFKFGKSMVRVVKKLPKYLWYRIRLVGLDSIGPVNMIKVMFSCSVYLTTIFLDRRRFLSDQPILVYILLPETDNCSPWFGGRERMTRKYCMINLHESILPDTCFI